MPIKDEVTARLRKVLELGKQASLANYKLEEARKEFHEYLESTSYVKGVKESAYDKWMEENFIHEEDEQ
tara:strand:- start:195 stop:401 length:207 start_codon:yes stop_codon:yes gene_type:complete